MKYALQLYSVRDCVKDGNFLEILAKVKEAGYEGVEFAGFHGFDAKTLRAELDKLGLVCVGAHCGLEDFAGDKLEETLENAKTLGTPQIGIGGCATGTEKDLTYMLGIMSNAQKRADELGIKTYFHNHTQEFKPTSDGDSDETIFARIMKACYIQVDTYWSFHAGVNTAEFIEENKDKIVTLHIKDGVDGHPVALGEGQNDIPSILAAGDKNGIEWAVVENDDPFPDGISDVTRSINYLKNL